MSSAYPPGGYEPQDQPRELRRQPYVEQGPPPAYFPQVQPGPMPYIGQGPPPAYFPQAQPTYAHHPGGYPAGVAVAPKSPAVALVASFLVAGLGTMLNGEVGKGLLIVGAYVVSILLMFVLIGFLMAPAVWIWGMVDAYHGAQKWNLAHGIVS